MRKSIRIGKRQFRFKKDAIAYYRVILNSYEFGQTLNDSDFDDLLDLLEYDYLNYLSELESDSEAATTSEDIGTTHDFLKDQTQVFIKDILVARVQFNTKCFEVIYSNGTSQYISYLMMINNQQYNPEKLFYTACRNSIHTDIRAVKQKFFESIQSKGRLNVRKLASFQHGQNLLLITDSQTLFQLL